MPNDAVWLFERVRPGAAASVTSVMNSVLVRAGRKIAAVPLVLFPLLDGACAGVRAHGAIPSADSGPPDSAVATLDASLDVVMRRDLGTGVRVDTGAIGGDAGCA